MKLVQHLFASLKDSELCKSALNAIWQLVVKVQGQVKDITLKQVEKEFLQNKELLLNKV
jgi:hypothetical protein